MRGRGGPRTSTDRATISVGRGTMLMGARTSRAGELAGIRTRGAAVRSAGWASRIVSTQPQSAGHVAAPAAGRADVLQFPSLASTGDTQQQNHGVFPQVRPSHCQTASTWGISDERSSATSAKIQIVRMELTVLLWSGMGRIADRCAQLLQQCFPGSALAGGIHERREARAPRAQRFIILRVGLGALQE